MNRFWIVVTALLIPFGISNQVVAHVLPSDAKNTIQDLQTLATKQTNLEKQYTRDISRFIENRDKSINEDGDRTIVDKDFDKIKSDYNQISELSPQIVSKAKEAQTKCKDVMQNDRKSTPDDCVGVLHLSEYRYRTFLDEIQARYIGVSTLYTQYKDWQK